MRTITLIFVWLSLSASAISQNLVAYYPFNGNANDESGNSINPTFTGAGVTLTTDRFGNANKAYNFDGATNSYMRMPSDLLPTANRTVSFWFNAASVSIRPFMLAYGGNGGAPGTSFLMGLNASGCGCYHTQAHYYANAVSYAYSPDPVNQWIHWVVTINGSTTKMYVNGTLVANVPGSFTSNTYVAGRDLAIGVMVNSVGVAPYTDVNGSYFQGKLDDIRIYDNAMSDAQVQQLYNTELTGLAAYFPFNGNVNDESGNGNNGTLINSPTFVNDRFNVTGTAIQMSATPARYVTVSNSPSIQISNQLSISAWVKRNSLNTIDEIVNKGGDVNSGTCNYGLVFTPGELIFKYNGGYHLIHAPQDLNWHHYAITTYHGSPDVKFYIDGVYTPTWIPQGNINLNGASTADLNIGAMPAGYYSNNVIDELRIYNRVLSPNEILQLADVPVMPGLLAYLPMNGNANDMSGNGHDGIGPSASLTTDRYNSGNSAYWFSQWYSNITLANSTNFNFNSSGFTLSAWIKYKSNDGVIIAKHNCWTPNGYLLTVNNNQLTLFLANGGSWTSVTTAESFINDKWYFVTAVYDGIGQASIYVDGVLKASNAVVYNNINTAPVIISGASNNCPPENFYGSIDEVKIYDSPLNAAQVMALYKESRGSGNALLFQGNSLNQMILPGPITPPPAFTLEAWIKRNAIQQWQWIFSGNADNTWQWGFNGNTMLFGKINGGGTVVSNTINIDDNKWHHVAVTYDGTSDATSFFVDGTTAGSGLINSSGIVAGTYSIGNRSGTTNSFDGYIDEFRIWGIVMDNAAIRNWMCRKITPDHPNYNDLGFYYNFDEPSVYCSYDVRNGQKALLTDGPGFIASGAPIGDASAVDFINPIKSTTLTLATGEAFNATASSGSPAGIIVYEVKDIPNTLTGTLGVGGNDHYFGVYVSGGSAPQYTATYDYTGNVLVSPATESALLLFKRNDNSAAIWANSGATLDMAANTLTVTGQNTEYILGSSGFPLPVTSLNLQARKTNTTTAQLNWQTATEINNKGFEVQRSFDGNYYTDVQFVNGAGNATDIKLYNVTDVPGRTGRILYRLKQIDFDGNSKLSNVVSVLFDKQNIIKIYPNPAQQQVTVEGLDNYNRVQVLDATGKLIKEQLTNGQYQLNINLNGLKGGMYLLRIVNEKETQTVKLIISN
jgi:Concanavalin A-like lectin/glucanases superfamily/Secretion system C-terminal sorting domain